MSLLLITHPSGSLHIGHPDHPERPDRLPAVVRGVKSSGADVVEVQAEPVDRVLLEQVHSAEFVDSVKRFCAAGGGMLDEDTYAVEASYDAALHAAGAGQTAVDAMLASNFGAAFVAVRPPGHHAETDRAMGFCLFNNVAITAKYLASMGQSVAIVDWDVHHGNGTQNTFYMDPNVLYISLHQSPFYPGTGVVADTGEGNGRGTTVNVPLPAGTASSEYLAAFARVAMPILAQFAPDWILVSSGYDAHTADPIGGLALESVDYQVLASAVASQVSNGRIVVMFEGGYDLDAISESASYTVKGLGTRQAPKVWPSDTRGAVTQVTDSVVGSLGEFWKLR